VMLQNGQPVPARVTTGMTDGTSTEIISGLQEGQAIVTGQTAAGAASTTGSGAAGGAGQRAPQSTNPLTGGGPGPGFRGG
jgi:hypothetical protein